MRPSTAPAELSADQLRREVATLLAAGVLRLHQKVHLAHHSSKGKENRSGIRVKRLASVTETVLSVQSG